MATEPLSLQPGDAHASSNGLTSTSPLDSLVNSKDSVVEKSSTTSIEDPLDNKEIKDLKAEHLSKQNNGVLGEDHVAQSKSYLPADNSLGLTSC